MAEQQKCKKLVAVLVEHQEYFGGMTDADCQWAIQNPKEAVAIFVEAAKNRLTKTVKKLLSLIKTVEVQAIESFVAKEKFRGGETIDGVRVAWLGDNFKKKFLSKVEKDVAQATLRIHKLEQDSLETPILAELGELPETTLAHFWELLKKQGNGEHGDLLVNGYANIAYIRDGNGVLWAVSARWYSDVRGWYVYASSVENPHRWSAGYQVVSR